MEEESQQINPNIQNEEENKHIDVCDCCGDYYSIYDLEYNGIQILCQKCIRYNCKIIYGEYSLNNKSSLVSR